jgi:hypothetical protein
MCSPALAPAVAIDVIDLDALDLRPREHRAARHVGEGDVDRLLIGRIVHVIVADDDLGAVVGLGHGAAAYDDVLLRPLVAGLSVDVEDAVLADAGAARRARALLAIVDDAAAGHADPAAGAVLVLRARPRAVGRGVDRDVVRGVATLITPDVGEHVEAVVGDGGVRLFGRGFAFGRAAGDDEHRQEQRAHGARS